TAHRGRNVCVREPGRTRAVCHPAHPQGSRHGDIDDCTKGCTRRTARHIHVEHVQSRRRHAARRPEGTGPDTHVASRRGTKDHTSGGQTPGRSRPVLTKPPWRRRICLTPLARHYVHMKQKPGAAGRWGPSYPLPPPGQQLNHWTITHLPCLSMFTMKSPG